MKWIDGFHFDLDEETRMVVETARAFAEKEVLPIAAQIDKEHRFPKELIPRMGALGFMGACVPSKLGGAILSQSSYFLTVEELAGGCTSTFIIVSPPTFLCIPPILEYGRHSKKKFYKRKSLRLHASHLP